MKIFFKQYKTWIMVVITVIISVLVIPRLIPSEKKRLANDIKSLKKAVEKEDQAKIFIYLDSTYRDRNGMSYEGLQNTIRNFLLSADSINILISTMKIKIDSIDGAKTIFASCSLGLKVSARYEGEKVMVFGLPVKAAPVTAYFKKADRMYKLFSAEY